MKRGGCLEVAAIVLAAGGATRMGRLKQLLPYGRRTLVQHAVEQAIGAGFHPIFVVVGAEAEAVQASVAAQPVEIVRNPNWKLGMGSSLAAGIEVLRESSGNSAGVAILLADQPLVTADHLRAMKNLLFAGAAPIVAAEYGGHPGVPAIFKRQLLPHLAGLPPDAGARHLLRGSSLSVISFALPEAAMDIDTPEDLNALLARAQPTV